MRLLFRIKKAFLQLFKLKAGPEVKVYHGYGNGEIMVIFGHVFSISPLPRLKFQKRFLINAFALLRLFMIKSIANARVTLEWEGNIFETITSDDGFFKFECSIPTLLEAGLHKVIIYYIETSGNGKSRKAEGIGFVMIPHKGQLAFISDIDDTFLISHTANFRKRLYVLLTKNAHSRRPFDGVLKHYELLSKAHTEADGVNPFFYVSSSEWNLYDFIKEFCRKNKLPEGVYLLSKLKKLSEVWKTGDTKHGTKFIRISRIIEAFPNQKFVLFGDDSQMDPIIYASIVAHFPDRIAAVYLRRIHRAIGEAKIKSIEQIENAGVAFCHFENSKEAITHSYAIGLLR